MMTALRRLADIGSLALAGMRMTGHLVTGAGGGGSISVMS
jgi:hypothetical protein